MQLQALLTTTLCLRCFKTPCSASSAVLGQHGQGPAGDLQRQPTSCRDGTYLRPTTVHAPPPQALHPPTQRCLTTAWLPARHHQHPSHLSPAPHAFRKHGAASLTQAQCHPPSCKGPQQLSQRNLLLLPLQLRSYAGCPGSTSRGLLGTPPLQRSRASGHPKHGTLHLRATVPSPGPPQPRRQTKHKTPGIQGRARAPTGPQPGSQGGQGSNSNRSKTLPFFLFLFPQAFPTRARQLQRGRSMREHSPRSSAYPQSHLLPSRPHPQALAPGGGSPRSDK